MKFSLTLVKQSVKETGRSLSSLGGWVFGMGMTTALFHCCGTTPSKNEQLSIEANPNFRRKLSSQSSAMVAFVIWIISLVLGIVPSSLAGKNDLFYDNSHVCIGLPLSKLRKYKTKKKQKNGLGLSLMRISDIGSNTFNLNTLVRTTEWFSHTLCSLVSTFSVI